MQLRQFLPLTRLPEVLHSDARELQPQALPLMPCRQFLFLLQAARFVLETVPRLMFREEFLIYGVPGKQLLPFLLLQLQLQLIQLQLPERTVAQIPLR